MCMPSAALAASRNTAVVVVVVEYIASQRGRPYESHNYKMHSKFFAKKNKEGKTC